jgi:hypothetical protein
MNGEIKMGKFNDPDDPWEMAERDLSAARQARFAGNEGKSRVCARRAAGKALRAAGFTSEPPLAAIRYWVSSQTLPDEVKKACANLVQTVDENYTLPEYIDLISDAETVITYLKSKPSA